MTEKEMYHAFRYEIDEYVLGIMPGKMRPIKYNGETVGFLLVEDGYIVGIWVQKEFRRRGLGRKAVLDYIEEEGMPCSLHTVNSNTVAQKFWRSLFHLSAREINDVDTLWQIDGTKVSHMGYTATVYGRSNLTVRDHEGNVLYHTVNRDENMCTEEGLKRLIEDIKSWRAKS